MERALLWFKCAAMHDPVRPVIKRPAALGWEAKQRKVDLVIERPLRAADLLHRMNGWFTADVHKADKIIKEYGKLKILDEYDLVVETENENKLNELSTRLSEIFHEEVWIEKLPKKVLL